MTPLIFKYLQYLRQPQCGIVLLKQHPRSRAQVFNFGMRVVDAFDLTRTRSQGVVARALLPHGHGCGDGAVD